MKQLCILVFINVVLFYPGNQVIGQYAAPNSANSGQGINSNVVGSDAGSSIGTGAHITIFGTQAGSSLTNGASNSFFGSKTGLSTTSGSSNSFFGFQAGKANTTGRSNAFFGSSNGLKNTTGNHNSFFGGSAGLNNTTGKNNSFYGLSSGLNNITGDNNCVFGMSAGLNNTNGSDNAFYGYLSGVFNSTGEGNSFYGRNSGGLTNTGSKNICIGLDAGLSNRSGSNNSYLGYRAGEKLDGSNNICLGSSSGPINPDHVSNRLFIDVESSDEPLIYGEFDNDFIKINGTFEVTAGLSNPSDVNLKNNFQVINETEILNKVAALDIKQWTYKTHESEIHIGVMAQDFHNAFGLGADDKHISTIDADGIALAAIKALKLENDLLKQELSDQKKQIEKLIELLEESLRD